MVSPATLPPERIPKGPGWVRLGAAPTGGTRWQNGQILVVSSLDMAELPDGSGEVGPQWQISISRCGRRPKPNLVRIALRAFGMVDAERDNHHPGVAEHFFLVVDPARRVGCECKATEALVVEPDGYTWTNPRPDTGEACRGCLYGAARGTPCPVHPNGETT